MTRSGADDDPGLPIKVGPCSNGEYDPVPLSPTLREFERRARELCESTARRLGMSRRQFLRSACGAATTLLVLDACSRDEARDAGREPGGTFEIPTTATTEPEAAADAVGGEEFVFDVQSHFLDYDADGALEGGGANFWRAFPQQGCGEDDPRLCYSVDQYLQAIFLESDTSMTVLSALPLLPEGSPLSPAVMEDSRRLALALCSDERILLHSLALPNVGSPAAALAAMDLAAAEHDIAAWKAYTHFAPGDARPWRLDDGDPSLPAVGEPFLAKAAELGIPTVCVHKGLGGEPYSSPVDIGPAAARHREISFVAYHSGYQTTHREGPYQGLEVGIDRLIAGMEAAGVGPNENAYAELGSTWWLVMKDPDQAAHVLGKLLVHVGADNILWGTDSIWYGSPQDQIQAFRAFSISEELQERHGYPPLTSEVKAKILGGNAARLYGVDPAAARCAFTRDELEQIRQQLPGDHQVLGPRTPSERRALLAAQQGWP